MRRLSIDKHRRRMEAARVAREMALPSIRYRDVLLYWDDIEKTYGLGRWRWYPRVRP